MTVGSARKRRIHKSGVLIVISLGAIFAGFPVFWMFVNSFKPNLIIPKKYVFSSIVI
jgi:multiple sugar transport system permease protein